MVARSPAGVCRFCFSEDVNSLVRCRLEAILPAAQAQDLVGDDPLDVEADLVLDGVVDRTALSSQGVFEPALEVGSFGPQQFVFAVKLKDLPRRCSLVFRLRGRPERAGEPPRLFRGVLPLFNDRAILRQGKQMLVLVPVGGGKKAGVGSGMQDKDDSWAIHSNEAVLLFGTPELREAVRLTKAVDLCERGCLPQAGLGFEGAEDLYASQAMVSLELAGLPWARLSLPSFSHTVVFSDAARGGDPSQPFADVPAGILSAPFREDAESVCGPLAALKCSDWLLRPLLAPSESRRRNFKCFVDDDMHEHPALLKSLRLARSLRASRAKDREARPSTEELKRLNELIGRTRRQFSAEEKHLIFRFRYTLTDQPGALTKFLHAVDWSDVEERLQAIEVMGIWSPVGIDDALELLSKDFRGIREVRRYAVGRLQTSASDDDLQLYLLQLVQALRYEPIGEAPDEEAACSSPRRHSATAATSVPVISAGSDHCALMRFLINRAVGSRTLATLFYWYVVAETSDGERGTLFHRVRLQFLEALSESEEGQVIRRLLERQSALRRKLLWSLQCAKINKRDRIEKKLDRFRQALAAEPPVEESASFDRPWTLDLVGGLTEGIPLPVDPSVSLLKIFPEQSFLLKSAMNPGVLTCQVCRTADKAGVRQMKKIMVKEGDDLRQDQLILQLIILMDSILKKYGLDLQLTPYQVIALSTNDGFIEFVPDSTNISTVLKEHNNDIQQFFRAHHPYVPPASAKDDHAGGADGAASSGYGPHNSFGIKPEVLENFIRSSAGYCVITYILGIGDRHLDNLMVTKEGRLFHIDFGYILGKDPKVFSPPMRLCKEMVEGMGGNTSKGYESFKSKCCQAFKILRRHGKLIINLLHLMADSGIKDLCGDPQFAILKVEQKFQEFMDDEQAERHFLNLIEESVSALFPVVMEKLHKLAIAMQ